MTNSEQNTTLEHKKISAFTLAEVLIALGIIGVIAALMIIALNNQYQEMQLRAAWKANFSLISSALTQIATDNGGKLPSSFATDGWSDTATSINMIAQQLKIVKKCSFASDPWGCHLSTANSIKYLNKSLDNNHQCASGSGIRTTGFAGKALLQNGAYISMLGAGNAGSPNGWLACLGTAPNSSSNIDTWPVYGTVVVDVNGTQLPNTWGRDIYILYYTREGAIKPVNNKASVSYACNSARFGTNCSFDYLMN